MSRDLIKIRQKKVYRTKHIKTKRWIIKKRAGNQKIQWKSLNLCVIGVPGEKRMGQK